jgi:tetratricopeptide (TPR) repeat protein
MAMLAILALGPGCALEVAGKSSAATATAASATVRDEALAVFPPLAERERERRDAATVLLANTAAPEDRRVRLLINRGGSQLTLGEYSAAVADFREAVRLMPREWYVRANLARALWTVGDDAGARAAVEAARKLDRKRTEPAFLAGLMDLASQRWGEAIVNFTPKTSNTADPDLQSTLFLFVASARQAGVSATPDSLLAKVSGQPLWPRPIADALLHRIDAKTLEALAIAPDPILEHTWQTQVAYFLGEQAAGAGRADEALTYFRRAVSLGMSNTYEYRLARARLRQAGEDDARAATTIVFAGTENAVPSNDEEDGWEPTDDTSFDREINRLVRSGAVERAIAQLRAKSDGELSHEHLRTLAGLLLRSGRTDEALAALRRSLRGDESDWQPLSVIALTEFQVAIEHGSGTRRAVVANLFTTAFDPAQMLERRAGAKHLANARATIDKAVALRPGDIELLRLRARILALSRDHRSALAAWQHILELAPEDDDARLGVANSLASLGRTTEAAPLVAAVLAVSPNDAFAHAVSADIARREHKPDDERLHNDWGKFGARLPPGSTLAFTPQNAASLDDIAARVVDFGNFSVLQRPELRASRVEKWLGDVSENATLLLVAALWNSGPGDEQALPISRELIRRGASAALRDILDHGENPVAFGAAARALAEAHEPDLYGRLIKLLVNDDDDLMRADIAGALAALGDSRALLPLVGLLDPGFRASPRLSVENPNSILGYQSARARAALALGSFDARYAHEALEAGANNPEIALHCRVALFELTKDPEQLKPIRSVLLYANFLEEQRTIEVLEKTGVAEALDLARAWRARKSSNP